MDVEHQALFVGNSLKELRKPLFDLLDTDQACAEQPKIAKNSHFWAKIENLHVIFKEL